MRELLEYRESRAPGAACFSTPSCQGEKLRYEGKENSDFVAIQNCDSRPLLDLCTSLYSVQLCQTSVYHKPEISLDLTASEIILPQKNCLLLCIICYWLELDLNLVPVLCSSESLWCFFSESIPLSVSYLSETKTSIFQCGAAQLQPGETWYEHNMVNTETKVLKFE